MSSQTKPSITYNNFDYLRYFTSKNFWENIESAGDQSVCYSLEFNIYAQALKKPMCPHTYTQMPDAKV